MKLPRTQKKTALDKDLKKITHLEMAAREAGRQTVKVGLGILFLMVVWMVAIIGYYDITVFPITENAAFIVTASIIGGYMALNIGANDVANNVGPAVGSKALSLAGALAIAAVFEAAGAILAGGDVIATVKMGIIHPTSMPGADTFINVMMAALLAAALWLNLATYLGAPVSTTHAIVGAILGAGIAATGFGTVKWLTMGEIAASWVISPLMGGLVAAAFLAFIKFAIYSAPDMIKAAKRWVPVLVAIMAAAFSIYLVMKGLKEVWRPQSWVIATIGIVAFAVFHAVVKPAVARAAQNLENRRKAVSGLFTIPLICSAALLSFAHGANDVANAVGPLAAIVDSVSSGGISTKVGVPFWVMAVGAGGISAGLVLFGPKLIRTVGEQITKLDRARAFCIALSAAITVIVASALGLPISTTHVAVGGVFGVGFLREYVARVQRRAKAVRRAAEASAALASGMPRNEADPLPVGGLAAVAVSVQPAMVRLVAEPPLAESLAAMTGFPRSALLRVDSDPALAEGARAATGTSRTAPPLSWEERRNKLYKVRGRKLVRRRHLLTIVAAWVVTVPLAALLSATLFLIFDAIAAK